MTVKKTNVFGADEVLSNDRWFEAARKWAGLDENKMTSRLERLDDETWKRTGEGLAEIDCWVRQE